MRIGHGYDAHRFIAGRALVLGGVVIAYERGLEAHSDGDVAIHALCDALIGAAAFGDIGALFPDTDPAYASIDSRILLRGVVQKLQDHGHRVGNVDVTIVAERPKLRPYVAAMCEVLAADLKVSVDRVSVKATTSERMGFTGREEGIAAHAVALISEAP